MTEWCSGEGWRYGLCLKGRVSRGSGQVRRSRQRELRSVCSYRWQNQLRFNLHHSHEYILQTHANVPIFLPFIAREVGVPGALPPSSLGDCGDPQWAEFINKFGFDCIRGSPHHELVCIHTCTLVDVPNTR